MKAKGIRILDKENRVVNVELPDILEEIPEGNLFYWSILSLNAMGDLGADRSLPDFEKEIDEAENGLFISWKDLNILSKKFDQIIDMVLIGCKDASNLRCYEKNEEMYESCDFVINMFDSSYWIVFSKDEDFIGKLVLKFKKTEFLESDF